MLLLRSDRRLLTLFWGPGMLLEVVDQDKFTEVSIDGDFNIASFVRIKRGGQESRSTPCPTRLPDLCTRLPLPLPAET